MTEHDFEEHPGLVGLPIFTAHATPNGHTRPGRVRSAFRLEDDTGAPDTAQPVAARAVPRLVAVPDSLVAATGLPANLMPQRGDSAGVDWGRWPGCVVRRRRC